MIEHGIDMSGRIELLNDQYELLYKSFDLSKYAPEEKVLDTELWITTECKDYILPTIEKMMPLKKLSDSERGKLYDLWEKVLALTARRSFHHYMLFRERDREPEGQTYRVRQSVMFPLVNYLEMMTFNDSFLKMSASFPPGYSKSYLLWMYGTWAFGVNSSWSFLKMSYSESLLEQFSGSMQEYMIDKDYSLVFPQFDKYGGDIFQKTKLSDWKLKDTPQTPMSHISRTRDGQVTGVRANFMIVFDDITKGREEAYKEDVHANYWGQYVTEWTNRKSKTNVKEVFIGTMWNPNDILGRSQKMMIEASDHQVVHEKYGIEHIVELYKNGKLYGVIIRVPQLDENEMSTCEHARTTEESLMLRDTMSDFEWSCVYQQTPISPEGRPFDYDNLRIYASYNGKNIYLENGEEIELSEYSKMVIDPTRKGVDNVSVPIFKQDIKNENDHYMIDAIFRGKSMDEVYDLIVEKVFIHNVNLVVLESNTATGLKLILEMKIKEMNSNLGKNLIVEIREKYNTEKKSDRIRNENFPIVNNLIFPKRGLYPANSDVGRFMGNVVKYSFESPNKHDDAPDSLAMYVKEVIKKVFKSNKVQVIKQKDFWG